MTKQSIFLTLNRKSFKGENGTILVIGGSERYTGAPIFTALGSLKSGSDLVYIFTTQNALITVKSLHEAIVVPIQFDKFILNKITACVIGPGLGILEKDEIDLIKQISEYLNDRNVPFVLDADAIHLYKHNMFRSLKTCILTPNFKEAKELTPENHHFCIYKGEIDIVKHQNSIVEISTPSSLKRCGGQGDILSGILGTAISIEKSDIMNACISSCELMRKSSSQAFALKGFSLIASDIFQSLTNVLSTETTNNHDRM